MTNQYDRGCDHSDAELNEAICLGRVDSNERDCDNEVSRAEEALFRGWLQLIEAGLDPLLVPNSNRLALILEIHADVARRHPLGIAVDLYRVIVDLQLGEDYSASDGLEMLIEDEQNSRDDVVGEHEDHDLA